MKRLMSAMLLVGGCADPSSAGMAGTDGESESASASASASATTPGTASETNGVTETESDSDPDSDSDPESDSGESSSSGGDESSSGGDCVPITCADMGYDCGTIFDGCGGTEECGSCVEPATCGQFEDNVCGCEETEWVLEHVAFMDDVGSHTSMAVDSEGDIHIAYYHSPNLELWYATRDADGGLWTNEVVDPGWQVGTQTAMVIDADDGVHIAYRDAINGGLGYAYKPAGGTWSTELASVDNNGVGADIDVDDNGVVHISHLRGNRVPYYTYGNLGDWTTEQAGTGPVGAHGANEETGIAVAPDGTVHLCIGGEILNGTSGALTARRLYYGYRSAIGAWTRQTLEGEGDGLYAGSYCDIELDDTGAVHIAHFETGNLDLRYATNPMPPLGDWTMESVDSEGDVGRRPSMEVDEFGTLTISYYDQTNEVLNLARKPLDGDWETGLLTDGTGLATEGLIGSFSALHAEDSANLHVAYYEGQSDDLYYGFLATCPL